MSGYLALAKKASTGKVADPTEVLERRRRRKLEEAPRRGLIIRWSQYPEWIKIHDPLTGDWHEVRASGCSPELVESANRHRKRGAAS